MEFEELLTEKEEAGPVPTDYSGIATGIVKKNWNEEAKGMVLVEMSLGEEGKTDTEWIPVMQPYCGNGFGQYFLPEVDTQVLVGFLENDINCPIVLGCLWNEEDLPPENVPNENNSIKLIQTKNGNKIELDETEGKEQIGIYTKGGISILMQDETQTASIQDNDGKTALKIDIKNGEIKIIADKKLTMNVGGEDALIIDGSGKKITVSANTVSMEGKQSMELKTQNAKIEGNMTEMKAQGSFKVNCSGMLELKGSMTKIN